MIEDLYEKYIEVNQLISTDTRNIKAGSIFFALKGASFNGNEFAAEAIRKGASYAVIDDPGFTNDKTILVNDVLDSLQTLANIHKRKSNFKIIALTGSNGKTTTKELIHAVLSKEYSCCATKGNLNNHIGVPLTILSTPQNKEFLILEMGANHIGEIEALCKIAEPDFGLITNIGKAHLDGFGGFEGVKRAKSELYQYLKDNNKLIFVNSSDTTLVDLIGNYPNTVSYRADPESFVSGTTFKGTLSLDIALNEEKIKFDTQLFGLYNVTNILAAVCIANYFNIDKNLIVNGIGEYSPSNNRSQIKKTKHNTLILDSYNANPSSMEAALKSFNEITTQGKKIVILGEMKELGNESPLEHFKLISMVSKMELDDYFFSGDLFGQFNLPQKKYFKTTSDLKDELKKRCINNAIILIKGSRSNKLEEIIEFL